MGSRFLITAGGDYLLVLAFSTTVINIIYCFLDGLSSATVTIASNIIGSNRLYLHKNLLKNALIFGTAFVVFFSSIMVLFQDAVISLYIEQNLITSSVEALKATIFPLILVCAASTFAKLVDGILLALKRLWVFAISCSVYSVLIYAIPLTAFQFFSPPPSLIVFTVAFVKAFAALITFLMIRKDIFVSNTAQQPVLS